MVAGVSYSSARRPRSSSTSTSSSIGGSVDLMTGEVSAIIRATQPLVSLGRENRTRFDIHSTMAQSAKEMDLKRFDGAGRRCIDWDGLRRDPELWFPEGDCLVYLSARGQSQRGPAFKIPYDTLVKKRCQHFLRKFEAATISPRSSISENSRTSLSKSPQYELYIPALPLATRRQALLHHVATRNFFAAILGRSVVGTHLGGALVQVLKSMNEHRPSMSTITTPATLTDNHQDFMDFIDEEGYKDMKSAPRHALAMLYLAENFQWKDLWLDAFTQCVGMFVVLKEFKEFEYISKQTLLHLQNAHVEMHTRLAHTSLSLSTFLTSDFSAEKVQLSLPARAHLDRFRQFLQTYYVAKLGFYPPVAIGTKLPHHTFAKSTLLEMRRDFESLYEYLANTTHVRVKTTLPQDPDEICVLRITKSFNKRHGYSPLAFTEPQMPESEADVPSPSRFKMFNFASRDKLRVDSRLVALAAMTKATNSHLPQLMESSLVRAYRCFEEECVFTSTSKPASEKISAAEARKVRWLIIYGMVQCLRNLTTAPSQCKDTDVNYDICVSIPEGCPPFKTITLPFHSSLQSRTSYTEIRPQIQRMKSAPATQRGAMRGSVHRAVSSLGNMPELVHPKPRRATQHEILGCDDENSGRVGEEGQTESAQSLASAVTSALRVDTTITKYIMQETAPRSSLDSAESSYSGGSFRWSSGDEKDGGASVASSFSGSPSMEKFEKMITTKEDEATKLPTMPIKCMERSSLIVPECIPQPLAIKRSEMYEMYAGLAGR